MGISSGPLLRCLIGGSPYTSRGNPMVYTGCTLVFDWSPTLNTNIGYPNALNYKLALSAIIFLFDPLGDGGKHGCKQLRWQIVKFWLSLFKEL